MFLFIMNKWKHHYEGLYVAGNITGIESAKVASAQGTLAGYSIAKQNDKIQQAIKEVKAVREAATIQFHPEIEAGRNKVERAFHEYVVS